MSATSRWNIYSHWNEGTYTLKLIYLIEKLTSSILWQSFALDRESGKQCYMILKGLSTTWGDEPTNHILTSRLESKVCSMFTLHTFIFIFSGAVDFISNLICSSHSKYRDQNFVTNHAAYLVFKCDYGFEKGLLDFGVYSIGSGNGVRRRPFLDPSRNMALPSENRGYGWMEIEMV